MSLVAAPQKPLAGPLLPTGKRIRAKRLVKQSVDRVQVWKENPFYLHSK
jgi:hypothetical protein